MKRNNNWSIVWKSWLTSASVLLMLATLVSSQTCPTDVGWIRFDTKCYKFNAFPQMSHAAASATCRNDGATLVSINTQQEHRFVSGWLLRNDQRKDKWLTSGLTTSSGMRWEGDGSQVTSLDEWHLPKQLRVPDMRVIYDISNNVYGWSLGHPSTRYSFICEISINEVYRIVQEHRDFTYGLNVYAHDMAPRGPTFVQEPDDTVILSTKTTAAYLECLADAKPEPKYMWLKQNRNLDMVPLEQDKKYSFTTGKLEIAFPKVDEDESVYQCIASNDYGTIRSRAVQLSFGSIGEFSNVAPATVEARELEGAQLVCPPISAKPGLSYQWFKNDYETVVRPDSQVHSFVSATGKLFFSEVSTSDDGIYTCAVTLISMGASTTGSRALSRNSLGFRLAVRKGAGNQIQPIIQNDFIYVSPPSPQRGRSVRLECFAYGTGPLKYTWSRANNKALPKHHMFMSQNRILILPSAELDDSGTYTCLVRSSSTNLEASKSLNLVIQAKPYFTYNLTHQHVDVGSQLTWHCEAAGQPAPTYQWFMNGDVLKNSPGTGVVVNRNTLTITSLSKDHNGMYQCGATNRYGTTFSTAQLRVLEIPPSFERWRMMKSTAASRDGNVTLMCNPVAAPFPVFSWTKDRQPLNLDPANFQEGDHYHLLTNGNLVITKVQFSDQGDYKCKVENKFGTAEDSTTLVVLERTVLTLPPADDRVEINMTASLQCRASYNDGIDMIYVWLLYNHIIDYDLEPEYRLGSGNQEGTLYIISAKFHNEGLYTCRATTAMSEESGTAYLTVLGPPGEPAGVYVELKSSTRQSQPNDPIDPDEVINPNTTRYILWTDGTTHGDPITNYFVEFRTDFDQRWRVHPDADNIPKYLTMDENNSEKRSVRLTNLKAGAGISFRVKARNSYGIGAPSLPTVITQIVGSKPTHTVTNIRGGGGSVGALTIVWDPLPVEDHNGKQLSYFLQWRLYDGRAQPDSVKWKRAEISHDKACFIEPDYKKGRVYLCKYVDTIEREYFFREYEVRIQTKNEYGDGPFSNRTLIMSAEELPLSAPEDVKGYWYNATALLIKWKPVPNTREAVHGKLKGYKINYWRLNYDQESNAVQNIIELKPGQSNLNQGLIIGLEPVIWYRFNVQAYNSAGNGPKSSNYERQTLNRVPSQFPTEVHVYSVEGYGVRVNFRGISTQYREEPLKGYKVQYWKARENILNAIEVDFGKMPTGVIRNLSSSELYELRVFAYSRAGQGSRSSPSVYFTVGEGQIQINPETDELLGAASSIHFSLSLTLAAAFLSLYLWRTVMSSSS